MPHAAPLPTAVRISRRDIAAWPQAGAIALACAVLAPAAMAVPVSHWGAREPLPPQATPEPIRIQHPHAGGVIEIWAVPEGVENPQAAVEAAQRRLRAAGVGDSDVDLERPGSSHALPADDVSASAPGVAHVSSFHGAAERPAPLLVASAGAIAPIPIPEAPARAPTSTLRGTAAPSVSPAVTGPPAASLPTAAPAWPARLQAELEALDARTRGDVGVFVYDLASGEQVSHRANEHWYLASMVKVPVALAVLQAVQRGELALDDAMALRASDYVDGAGQTNRHGPGETVSVRYLLEQMIVYSDNTSTDMLIRRVGLDAVNRLVQSRVPSGLEPITTLADVRRRIYGEITPAAGTLSGRDFLRIRAQPADGDRVREMLRITGAQPAPAAARTLNDAYARYYATLANAGRLDAFGELLAQLAQGDVLDATRTAVLLDIMQTVRTGDRRIKAGLPTNARFAHKTGTQRARFCDGGIVFSQQAQGQPLVVVACTRGDGSLGRAERTLRGVGEALRESGYFSEQG